MSNSFFTVWDPIKDMYVQPGQTYDVTLSSLTWKFNSHMGRPILQTFNTESHSTSIAFKLIEEEFNEARNEWYVKPGNLPDKKKLRKELCDLVYVILGLYNEFGWDFEYDFKKVHESNMSKLDENGNANFDENGKVIKGPNYKPPEL